MSARRSCRADKLTTGMPVSVGYAFGPIAELRKDEFRIALRIEGSGQWHSWQPDEQVYLEPAEHLMALQAARRQ